MAPWEKVVRFSGKLIIQIDQAAEERDYKVAFAEKAQETRAQLLAGDEAWFDNLRRAVARTNLLNQYFMMALIKEYQEQSDAVRSAVLRFWAEPASVSKLDELENSLRALNKERLSAGGAIAFGSLLLMSISPAKYPPFRARKSAQFLRLLGLKPLPAKAPASERYTQFLKVLDDLCAQAQGAGLPIRDRLDAQGLMWTLLSTDPDSSWSSDEATEFRLWRGDAEPSTPAPAMHDFDASKEAATSLNQTPAPLIAEALLRLKPASEELANELYLDREDLQEIIDLLQARRQIVFYGPPGTGKTYIGKHLARFLSNSQQPDSVQIVQFHPSYSYEDFFEGFRPAGTTEGQVGFSLHQGPLRRLAALASREENRNKPYFLLIDEMNRGNLAKVFGELYFLLEYRDDKIRLQYSPEEEFQLPPNLFIIGTMNSSDRSIAMVDAAIRRRFAFVELHPQGHLIGNVLPRFLTAKQRSTLAFQMLTALNDELDSDQRDLAIGPSYFMRDEAATVQGLRRIWKYELLPLLEEYHYGFLNRTEVHNRFGFDAISSNLDLRLFETGTTRSDYEEESDEVR